jgi:hypothetical protein
MIGVSIPKSSSAAKRVPPFVVSIRKAPLKPRVVAHNARGHNVRGSEAKAVQALAEMLFYVQDRRLRRSRPVRWCQRRSVDVHARLFE